MRSVPSTQRSPTTWSTGGLVCSVDHLASAAGAQLLAAGGSAVDAAVGANAVLAVTTPHMNGLGGDLFALVHHADGSPPDVVDAAGRAGSGADAARLRSEGHRAMPFTGDVRSATVPGCVDGWLLLHERHGRLPLADVLAPAHRLAADGFPVSPMLAFMLHTLDGLEGCDELALPRPDVGERLVRPGVARQLEAIVDGGREGFYGGEFGRALVEVGRGEFTADDLAARQARWVEPLGARVWGHDVWTVPPPSQGYLIPAAALIAELVAGEDLPDPADGAWAHLLVESARLAAADRLDVLHAGADGSALLAEDRLRTAAARFDPSHRSGAAAPARGGGTMHLCAADRDGTAVSLIQSNAHQFGCGVAVPGTGVLLHNRGIGFSLEPGHPAEYAPGRQPPHTLAPALVTRPDGSLRAVLGTMGGDSQPQVVLQILARLLVAGAAPGDAIEAPRLVLRGREGTGFDTWRTADQVVRIEEHAPRAWVEGLAARGHEVEVVPFDPGGFGHAHVIERHADGRWAGADDPRAMTGATTAST
ncbi:gamma-glutamyltransferase family protein [Aquihabitans sp. McL0605]|uniref:gamma-glutamyltransferase family protein n=1 Tax=Aquihabitans sp. McL0605 TaxID=3415671 RepID=UPI003CED6657